jgi:branched-chain amino acid transport system substrate-binding protein
MPYISASYAGSLSSPKDVQDKIEFPDKSQTIEIDTTGAPYNFFVGTDYSTSIRLAMNFIKDANGKRVAFFYCSPSDCSEPIPAGKIHALKRELTVAKDLKIELNHTAEQIDTAVKEYFDKTTATSDLWIWVGNTTHTAISIVQAVAKYAPQAQLIVNVWGFDETMFARCRVTTQAINPCYDRVFGLMPFAAYGELNYPGMKELVVTHNRQREFRGEDKHDTRYKNVRYVQGYVSLLVWKMAIERLIDAEREITGYNIRTELERFRNMETGGLTFPISFSATDHRPTFGTLIYSFGQEGYLEYQGQVSIELEDKWLGW